MKCARKSRKYRLAQLKFLALLTAFGFLAGCGSDLGTGLTTDTSTGTTTTDSTDTTTDEVLARRGDGGSQQSPSGGQQPPPVGQQSPDGDRRGGIQLTEVRTIDGTDNNFAGLGATELVFAEDVTRAYGDGVGTPSGDSWPNPREISNAVVDQTEDTPDPGGRTAFLWMWGQFLDHDITLTHENGTNDFPVPIPTGDPYFDPYSTGTQTLPFSRSVFADGTGVSADSPRAQVNSITSFVDASNVYGSDEERASALRTFENGRLATSEGDLPPFNTEGLENAGGTSDALYLCGDIRSNENILLTSMHTIFLREHNRIAAELQARYPEMTDEQLYQAARKRVGAIVQAITYNEYIPALLGQDAIPPYRGYRGEVDPRIGILFATAAYRLGHSQVGTTVPRLDANGEEIAEGNLNVADAFFSPSTFAETGVDPLLRGAATEPSQATDSRIIGDLRNFLFGPPGSGGLDLASLNIQRGRDHGLPDFNTVRQDYNLAPVSDFAQMTSDPVTQAGLALVYDNPSQVDAWVGLLSEDKPQGAVVGPTLRRILSQQFRRLRDGDRFFYLNDPDLAREIDQINRTRLSDVIQRNSGISGLQANVFFLEQARQPRPRPRRRDPNRRIPQPSI
ncbi:MAG: peroxidase [Candidatus Eremiobacteraeota bacterium]|nr:peroxidase [Candidatus Eremiobacteraeota bacterium]